MDETATILALKQRVCSFCEERDWDQFHTPKDLAIGICTEAGELLDSFRFLTDSQVNELMNSPRKNEIENELADVFFFTLRFAQRFGIDLHNALVQKMELNESKYPVEKARGKNLKSKDL